MNKNLLSVNVTEGFLPHFAAEFLTHYGEESLFVTTVSDLFTIAVARALENSGQLHDPTSVARFSNDDALRSLRQLVHVTDDVGLQLLQEAHSVAPLGSAGSLVDALLGEGVFRRWLTAFEAQDYIRCSEVLQPTA